MTVAPPESSLLARLAAFTIRRAPLVIGTWLLFVVAVNVLVPQLETIVAKDSTPFVPETAPSLQAVKTMDETFGNGKSRSFIVFVAEREGGLTRADKQYVVGLSDRLRADTEHVTYAQDLSEATLRDALTSEDGEAIYFQIGLAGYTGAPTSVGQVEAVRDDAEIGRPAGLEVAVTGASATITDMVMEIESSIVKITAVTLVLIAIILFIIYRSFVVTVFVLGVIGIALAASRGAVAYLGLHDVFDVSTFTGSFLTAIVLGATTDYAIFLISRFHEERRRGVEPKEAARVASSRISGVIIGSALTVILANACLALAHVGLFRTTGPAIAVSITLALAISITLTPPLVAILGARGLLEPRPRPERGGWDRWGDRVVARPGLALTAGLVPLVALAAFFPAFAPSYDERRVLPGDTESGDGYALMDAHYPANEALPDFVLVTADHDLRNADDLAALEQAASSVARVQGIGSVRAVTRPTGTTITEASVGYQAGIVGDRLADAKGRLSSGSKDADRLVDGAGQLADGADQLADGAEAAATGATRVLDGVGSLHSGLEQLADGSGDAVDGSAELRAGAKALADGLDTAVAQTQVAVDGLGLAHQALTRSLTCGLDPYCKGARDGIRQIWVGERDQLVPGLREAARGARALAEGTVDLQDGLQQIRAGLTTAEQGAAKLEAGQRTLADGLDELASGTDRVADAGSQVAGGTQQLTGSIAELEKGLATAASYLKATAAAATSGSPAGGFYLPPSAMKDDRFALASGAYLSADGRVARMIVLGNTDAFGAEASARSKEIARAAREALRGTTLAGSDVAITGMAATNNDIAELSSDDFRLVAIAALIAVFLVLLLLIRSVVAALFLLGSVVLSYIATMGLAVLVFQILLDNPLEWTVACIAFVLLVAVGADYNLLLIKRVHEESPDGSRAGIARAVGLTGGVITAAGVIFASSLFAMMSGSVDTLVQLGFTVGIGLLIDTFVVRTLVVPAFAALVGPRLWWPSRVPAPEPAA